MTSKKKEEPKKKRGRPPGKVKPIAVKVTPKDKKKKGVNTKSIQNLIKFKPGQSGNPDGAKKHNPELKMIKNLTEKELVDIGNIVIKGTLADLEEIAENEDATVLQTMLASVAGRIIRKGDMQALDVLLNRLVGKVKDKVQHSGIPESTPPRIVLTLPRNGKEAS